MLMGRKECTPTLFVHVRIHVHVLLQSLTIMSFIHSTELNAKVKPKQGKDNSEEESATRGNIIILYDSFVQCSILACLARKTVSVDCGNGRLSS